MEEEAEEYQPRVWKPFAPLLDSLGTVKGQYDVLQDMIMDISRTVGVKSLSTVEHIKVLPKKKDVEDLQTRVDCLLKENNNLKDQVVAMEAEAKEREELKERISSLEAEVVEAQNQRDEAITVPGSLISLSKIRATSSTKPSCTTKV